MFVISFNYIITDAGSIYVNSDLNLKMRATNFSLVTLVSGRYTRYPGDVGVIVVNGPATTKTHFIS